MLVAHVSQPFAPLEKQNSAFLDQTFADNVRTHCVVYVRFRIFHVTLG